jgi:hypothetical protein
MRGRKAKPLERLSQYDFEDLLKTQGNPRERRRYLAFAHLKEGKSFTEAAMMVKIELIPIPGNNFIFKCGPCAENRLKKKGLYFSILAPSFLSDFRPLSRCLNVKLFPGISIIFQPKAFPVL